MIPTAAHAETQNSLPQNSAPAQVNFDDLVSKFSSREWRLENLYYITDPYGQVVMFKLNDAQRKLLEEMHFLNLVLKARQMGFSTFILILALDCCLFNNNFSAGLIADTLDNAQKLLKRIKFAYKRLPTQLTANVKVLSSNLTTMEFSNGSSIVVGTSLRSDTFHLIHISEYGKVCATTPDKAGEIKSGALNTLAPRQLCFIESTAEGKSGDFYDKVNSALAIKDAGRPEEDMEYRLHFFPWHDDPRYAVESDYVLSDTNVKYFDKLKTEYGIKLTRQQKCWYAIKEKEQGDDMLKEYPSTVEEAFEGAKQGSYFAKNIRAIRQRGLIRPIPFEPRSVVNTFWDLGVNDTTTIWLHQEIAGINRFVGFFEDSGEGIAYYIDYLNKWRNMRGAVFGVHYAPHDVEHRKQGLLAESIKTIARKVGFNFVSVPRTPDKLHSIQNVRTKLPQCEFDEPECEVGIDHLNEYCREWDSRHNIWKPRPRHDEHSNAADGFMTFADGYSSPVVHKSKFVSRAGVV